MDILYKKIILHQLTYWWIDPGGTQHVGGGQKFCLYGYFPTSEEAAQHAKDMNLGDPVPPFKLPDTFRSSTPRRPLKNGYEIKEVRAFTLNDGLSFELAGEYIALAAQCINRNPVTEDHESMFYRKSRSKSE